MSASTADALSDYDASAPLTRSTTRWALGARLFLSMMAAGLLCVAVIWHVALPDQDYLAQLVAGAAAVLVAIPVLTAAWNSIVHPSLHGMTDLLVGIALVAAWATGDLMTAALLPIVMIIGHVLEERSLLGSREAIRAMSRLVSTVTRRVESDGSVREVPTGHIRIGDLIDLRPGDRVPVDGIVAQGRSSLDTASLTGESAPAEVQEDEPILAGSINLDGHLRVQVSRVGNETTLGKIIALMETAEQAKPPVTRLLEQYAGPYISLVLLIAGAAWLVTQSSEAMLAVLVASCPCALVLAAPATAVAAIAVAARHGILIKGSAFLEHAADVSSVMFDKTGTITRGELSLLRIEGTEDTVGIVALAAALGSHSSHPVSRSLARLGGPNMGEAVTEVQEVGGLGVTGIEKSLRVALGRQELFDRLGIITTPQPDHDGPIVGVSRGQNFLGWMLLSDEPRPEAMAAVAELRSLGLQRQVLLTGDRARVARRIGEALGLTEIHAEALPEEKMRRVLQEVENGHRPLVVGDGINDSLALKVGAVGVAMGAQGTDVALASADIVLMTSDLRRLATCLRLSRRCRRTIHVNVGIGLGWTIILVALAGTGMLGINGAIVAAVFHNMSTLLGMANAGCLLRFDEMSTQRVPETAPIWRATAAGAAPNALTSEIST
ncbi:MAG TPA: cation-translocating P-type ATPase [Rhodopila sp.]|uniref:cation-translocating P-type ATPase n=1 Tax=Rhodopila sp. TaxID=2480087 RepID=UPI002C7EE443|nr:cation-translocating P-type ATPase [Rhodopila sp.]HVY17978.1 cation-translocating P-type ATPase [Rhodopila sp.]